VDEQQNPEYCKGPKRTVTNHSGVKKVFGKKKEPEAKQPTAREILAARISDEIEQLQPGQILTYKLPEFYWGGYAAFFMAELNPLHPKKGKKYNACIDQIANGKIAGKKSIAWQTDKPLEIGEWISQRDGEYGSVERYQ
jgi:hypothetical protein